AGNGHAGDRRLPDVIARQPLNRQRDQSASLLVGAQARRVDNGARPARSLFFDPAFPASQELIASLVRRQPADALELFHLARTQLIELSGSSLNFLFVRLHAPLARLAALDFPAE